MNMKKWMIVLLAVLLVILPICGGMAEAQDNTAPEDKVELISLNTFIVPGDMKIDDANEILGLKLESDEMNTVGGWLLEQFGYLPASGTVLIKNKNLFTAEDVSGRRIVSVRVKKSN